MAAVGIGCGIGTNEITQSALQEFLPLCNKPLVLDADALNILSLHPTMLNDVPNNTILTPHVGEFERMFGQSKDPFARLELQRSKSQEWQVFILLKGAHSCLTTPDGRAIFNSTGNHGMATAGSGDVLTGLITGLLAQGYEPEQAAIYGMFVHGVAGDLARGDRQSEETLTASDIIDHLGEAFKFLPQEVF
ncbi:MAG: NAD(P)H-hydrate dehydratase [Saprospiraceae bacterium]|nr:NAD(P)H-hydrate dehydratase [Saprospiraceae bacterium]